MNTHKKTGVEYEIKLKLLYNVESKTIQCLDKIVFENHVNDKYILGQIVLT